MLTVSVEELIIDGKSGCEQFFKKQKLDIA
jgi:hypothetical protein